jgi:hypothetical protein
MVVVMHEPPISIFYGIARGSRSLESESVWGEPASADGTSSKACGEACHHDECVLSDVENHK